MFESLKRKKEISLTPLEEGLKALIFALKDSAEAFVEDYSLTAEGYLVDDFVLNYTQKKYEGLSALRYVQLNCKRTVSAIERLVSIRYLS